MQTLLKTKPIQIYFKRKRDEEKEESGEGDSQGSTNEASSQGLPEAANVRDAENNVSEATMTLAVTSTSTVAGGGRTYTVPCESIRPP